VTRSAPTLTAADGRLSRLRVVEHQRISVFDVFNWRRFACNVLRHVPLLTCRCFYLDVYSTL